MPTEFQDTISLVSSAIQIGATVRFPLLLWLLLLKDYNNLYTIRMSLPLMKDYNNLYTIRMSLPLMKDYNNLDTIHISLPLMKDYNNLYTIHKSLPLMKDYNNLDTIHKSRHVSTLLSHAASPTPFNQAPSLHGVQGGDDRHHLYDEGSQASHAPPESGGVKAVHI